MAEILGGIAGGLCLPDLGLHETEIARLTIESTLRDVISIRARPGTPEHPILYRVADEYETEFKISPEWSESPFSLRELVGLIDTASSDRGGAGLDIIDSNLEGGADSPETSENFLEYSSDFYPGLDAHYWFAVQEWLYQKQIEWSTDELDGEGGAR